MGEMYEAEQEKCVRRRLALKVVKRGMETKQVLARFEAVRQALALMDHPNIAKVFDAGETERGRPFFAMEIVWGIPITEHCDRHRIGIRERLGLFMQVCDALHHDHRKAVIHCDIKPSNVLVSVQDGVPVPKVIDFGLAKAMAQPPTEKSLFTQFGHGDLSSQTFQDDPNLLLGTELAARGFPDLLHDISRGHRAPFSGSRDPSIGAEAVGSGA
jgi:non-specific serine/threonine protein kinase/serine/threonine-protein kinase